MLQVFFLLKESELTPSGANLLDGRYAVFGYVTQGQDALGLMKASCWAGVVATLNGIEGAALQACRGGDSCCPVPSSGRVQAAL